MFIETGIDYGRNDAARTKETLYWVLEKKRERNSRPTSIYKSI